MARPRSEDKRQTILRAATQLFAEEGLNAPTARIAKAAGVAEGTIFTYFANKDVLMNQLYLELKSQLRLALVPPPESAALREQVWLAWRTYVNWGIAHPEEHQVLAKLALSPKITETTQAEGSRAFCDVSCLLERYGRGSLAKPIPGVCRGHDGGNGRCHDGVYPKQSHLARSHMPRRLHRVLECNHWGVIFLVLID